MIMKPKLFVCAAAVAVAVCGCASQQTVDWNNGPYAEYGFTYDFVLSPVAALSTEDAEAVMAVPSGYVPAVFVHRHGDVNFYQPLESAPPNAPMNPGAIQNTPPAAPVAPPGTVPVAPLTSPAPPPQ
jgi:hypothetical protein